MNKKVLFVGLLAGCFGMNAFAATEIYVSASTGNDSYNGASWETAYKTLQYAVASVRTKRPLSIWKPILLSIRAANWISVRTKT